MGADRRVVAAIGLGLIVAAGPHAASGRLPGPGPQDAPAVTVTLQKVAALAGQDLTVPIALDAGDAAAVGLITFTVSFPAVLTFDAASPAYTLRELDGEVSATPVRDEAGRLAVRVRAGAGPLLEGALGYLVFRVAPDAAIGALAIGAADLRVETAAGDAVTPARIDVGEMTVMHPADAVIPPCFYYMH